MSMPQFDDLIRNEIPKILAVANSHTGPVGFFLQEMLRFRTITDTLLSSGFKLDETAPADERFLTHVLTRSLVENFYRIVYVFDDLNQYATRYEELNKNFKTLYAKAYADLPALQQSLPMPGTGWSKLSTSRDLNSMLVAVRNVHGARLDPLYAIYRIASFDTHGNSLSAMLEHAFGQSENFPVLKIKNAFEMMASEYLDVLRRLRTQGLVP
jgi:hypothetical protein